MTQAIQDPMDGPSNRKNLLLHLSDVHLFKDGNPIPPCWDNLCDAIRQIRAETHGRVALVISGDVIDTPTIDPAEIARVTRVAIERVQRAMQNGEDPPGPIAILPGNHDRRESGIQEPWTDAALDAIRSGVCELSDVVVAAASRGQRYAAELESLSKALGASVVAYDSTHTYSGMFSAGGFVRTDDLLSIRSISKANEPVIIVLHHHLMPTPVMDLSMIHTDKAGLLARMAVNRILPKLISFADREELFMTAVGAGSLISSMHALQSAVLVLHGHKHYPTARLLTGTTQQTGDIIVASAGSAGVAEPYHVAEAQAKMWPSFNAIWMNGHHVDIETVYFAPGGSNSLYRQPLVSAERHKGMRWSPKPVPTSTTGAARIELDEARFVIDSQGQMWNFECTRTIRSLASSDSWREPVAVSPGGIVEGEHVGEHVIGTRRFPTIKVGIGSTTYRARAALCGTCAEARKRYGEDESPFEWVGLTVRKASKQVRLIVEGLPEHARSAAFATVTDLHTGERRPIGAPELSIDPATGTVTVDLRDCSARRFLQVLWPLEGPASAAG